MLGRREQKARRRSNSMEIGAVLGPGSRMGTCLMSERAEAVYVKSTFGTVIRSSN